MAEFQTDYPQPEPNDRWRLFRRLAKDEIVLLSLIALSVVGMAITDAEPDLGLWFWLIMVPVYGATGLFIQWSRGQERGPGWSAILRSQVMHWLGLLIAIKIAYLLLYMGRLNYENTGYVVALMLALTTYLSGVHLGRWRISLAGIFLAVAVILAGWLEQYAWLFLIIAGLVAAGISFYLKSRMESPPESAPPAPDEDDDYFGGS
jgi:hypothetical protein